MTLVKDMNWKSFARSENVGECEAGGSLVNVYFKEGRWYALVNSHEVYELNAHDAIVYRNHMKNTSTPDEIKKAMQLCMSKAAEHKDIAGFYMSAYAEFQKRFEKAEEIEHDSKKAIR